MSVALKVKKPTDLRENLFETLEKTGAGEAFLIQHKTGNAVLQGENEYVDILDQIETLKAINRGLQDYLDGKTIPHSDIRAHMKAYAKKRSKK
jgi:hypothetical protein